MQFCNRNSVFLIALVLIIFQSKVYGQCDAKMPQIIGSQRVCGIGAIVEYSTSTYANSYLWYINKDEGTIVEGGTGTLIKVRWKKEGVNKISLGVFYACDTFLVNPKSMQGSFDVSVSLPPQVTFDTLPTLYTNSDSLILTGGSPAGGTYLGTGVKNGVFYPNISKSGLFSIGYTYIDTNRCSSQAFSEIKVLLPPVAETDSNANICTNNYILKAEAISDTLFKGIWRVLEGESILESASSNLTKVQNLSAGKNIFQWTITGKNNYTSYSTVIVNYNKVSQATINQNDTTICIDSLLLKSAPVEFGKGQWIISEGTGIFDQVFENQTFVRNLSDNNNTIEWKVTNNNCTSSAQIHIEKKNPNFEFENINSPTGFDLCDGKAQISLSESEYQIQWKDSTNTIICQNEIATNLCSGIYKVSVQHKSAKCTSEKELKIEYLKRIYPDQNILTPNDDGINDVLKISELIDCLACYPNNELLIMNEQGIVVYQKQNYQNDFRGIPNKGILGNKLNDGTYFYIFRLNADDKGRKGFFELKIH